MRFVASISELNGQSGGGGGGGGSDGLPQPRGLFLETGVGASQVDLVPDSPGADCVVHTIDQSTAERTAVTFQATQTLDLDVSGAGGLDTGSVAVGLYCLYAISGPEVGDDVIASLQTDLTAVTLPEGYTSCSEPLAAVYVASLSPTTLQTFYCRKSGAATWLVYSAFKTALSVGEATTPTAIDCSAFVADLVGASYEAWLRPGNANAANGRSCQFWIDSAGANRWGVVTRLQDSLAQARIRWKKQRFCVGAGGSAAANYYSYSGGSLNGEGLNFYVQQQACRG